MFWMSAMIALHLFFVVFHEGLPQIFSPVSCRFPIKVCARSLLLLSTAE